MIAYLESPLTTAYLQDFRENLIKGADGMRDEDGGLNFSSIIDILMNNLLLDMFNGKESKVVKEIRSHSEEEYKYLKTMVDDVNEQLNSALNEYDPDLFDAVVTNVEIYNGLFKLEVKLYGV